MKLTVINFYIKNPLIPIAIVITYVCVCICIYVYVRVYVRIAITKHLGHKKVGTQEEQANQSKEVCE